MSALIVITITLQNNTMIAYHAECKEHPFQDKRYGKKFRVVNPSAGYGSTNNNVSCTVCGEKFSTVQDTPKKKKNK